jgi:hypothetical protein
MTESKPVPLWAKALVVGVAVFLIWRNHAKRR